MNRKCFGCLLFMAITLAIAVASHIRGESPHDGIGLIWAIVMGISAFATWKDH